MLRRNAFQVEPAERGMPEKAPRSNPEGIRPTVSRDMAEIAAHLSENPSFEAVFECLRDEAVQRMCNSEPGESGRQERDAGRLELATLETIKHRLGSMAAEMALHAKPQDYSVD